MTDSKARNPVEYSETPRIRAGLVAVKQKPTLQSTTEFGGTVGVVILLLFIPLFGIYYFMACNETECSFRQALPYQKYLQIKTYLNATAALYFYAFAFAIAILSVIRFGGLRAYLSVDEKAYTYVINGMFSCAVIVIICIGLQLRGVLITDFIVTHRFQLFVASYLFALFLSILTYVNSFTKRLFLLNWRIVGNSWIYEFFMGRDIHPNLFGLVFTKMLGYRIALIGAFLMNYVYAQKALEPMNTITQQIEFVWTHPTLFVLVVLKLAYLLDSLWNERRWVTTFEFHSESFGHMSAVGYLIYPFMSSALAKYVYDHNIELKSWQLMFVIVIYIIGFILFRGSNNQKDNFRTHLINHSSFSYTRIIFTGREGNDLLCSGYWGFVRHPNYLGDILINLSFTPFVFGAPPALIICINFLILLHRSVRDHNKCKNKYGKSWDVYCTLVKYILFPKIF